MNRARCASVIGATVVILVAAVFPAAAALSEQLQQLAKQQAALRVQYLENRIDKQTGAAQGQGATAGSSAYQQSRAIQDQAYQLATDTQTQLEYEVAMIEHMVALLRERAALTTEQRLGRTLTGPAKQASDERDRAAWVDDLPRPEAIRRAYPADDRDALIKRAAALDVLSRHYDDIPELEKPSLKADLLEYEFELAIARLKIEHPELRRDGSERFIEDVRDLARDRDGFAAETIRRFMPTGTTGADTGTSQTRQESYQQQIDNAVQRGFDLSIGLAIVLAVIYVAWAVVQLAFNLVRKVPFGVTRTDDRLDITFRGSTHGLGTLIMTALWWGALMLIVGFLVTMMDDPFVSYTAGRPHRETHVMFLLMFIALCLPLVVLLLSNLLRFRKRKLSITSDAVIVGGKSYPLAQVSEFFVYAPAEGPTRTISHGSGGVYFIGDSAMVAAAAAGATVSQAMRVGQRAATGIGNAMYMMLSKVRFKVCLIHAGNRRTLASDLSERRAEKMLQQIAGFLEAQETAAQKAEGGETLTVVGSKSAE